ncbi:capsular exopolysaccharide biosynthesis protein (Wzm) [Gloeocapsa sp. PCC 7428]|uniref:polysaccharide pyruvyl transferase family protein n=1 Tax=Gloeocapsa sp. PCC 7428 TaxID=1173026 RepID=UPI0002A5F71C|nr:polysaccharide pyruvyl transferase family protein [Gloeocapsa sp. PCC 7428]AFZ32187.1 capsular exopolysaccharide biosynthesis protein (Wzm) [Gloeocapsa sp. PCC 7428]
MSIITLFDTSVCSSNLGDKIIIDAIKKQLDSIFSDSLFIHVQTHDRLSKSSYSFLKKSRFAFVGGTNLLSSNMNRYNQWKIDLRDSLFIKNAILLGVGWWQYQQKPNLYTSVLLKSVLSKKYTHSVRDSYTEQQLRKIGITNVINTSCPTLWNLTSDHCRDIPRGKADSVLVTFTEYNQNIDYDSQLINLLQQNYQNIYFWTQQPKDYEYAKQFCNNNVQYIAPKLKALDTVLERNKNIDYIGTRLHAGIRALQHKKRTLILSVDNRATEISKDTNLPVIDRGNLQAIHEWIHSEYETKIIVPEKNIAEWKAQFGVSEDVSSIYVSNQPSTLKT